MLDNVIHQLVTVSVGLGGLAVSYLLWLLTGVLNVGFTAGRTWSWRRTMEDLTKVILLVVIIAGWVVVMNFIDWYASELGADISGLMEGVSVAGMAAGILGGTINYSVKVGRNFINFFNTNHLAVHVTEEGFEEGSKKVAQETGQFVEAIVERFAPPIEPSQPVPTISKMEIVTAFEESERGTSLPVATVLKQLKDAAECHAFLMEDGKPDIYRGQCTRVPMFVYRQLGITSSMGNGKDVARNLIAQGYAEPCEDEPGAIVSADNGTPYGHVWVSLGNGYLVEQNAAVKGTKTADFGCGIVYSCRVGKLNEWNRGKLTYCRLKGLTSTMNAADSKTTVSKPKSPTQPAQNASTGEVVSYVYQQGDTFGAVITKLGLKTKHGLWGDDGDVAYYTAQLREQGITGNIPVGAEIRLTKRKA